MTVIIITHYLSLMKFLLDLLNLCNLFLFLCNSFFFVIFAVPTALTRIGTTDIRFFSRILFNTLDDKEITSQPKLF